MEVPRISVVLLILYLINVIQGAHILAVFSSVSFSDHLVFRGYVSLLAKRGHSIVVMTAYPGHFQHPDIERIVELDVGKESQPFWEEFRLLLTNTDDYSPRIKAMNEHSLKLAIAQLKSKQMQALLINPNVKFDLVVTEADVPVLYALADKYQAPHIAITTSSGKLHQYESKGVPINPILYPDVNSISYGSLSSWQKVAEFRRYYHTKNEYYNNHLPFSDAAAKKLLDLKRDLIQVEKDIDMLFVASSPLLIGNRPVVPAIAFVDRLHIKPGFVLPPDLQATLDASTKGAIYFSLGAIQESEDLAPNILQTLTDAFKELPYTVLWKIGNATVINKPDNVIAAPWFPQQQVLAHPNVKAFITHGGARSLEEAVFYQMPIVGLPLVQSRKVFINEITKHGAGEILDSYHLDKETVKVVVTKVATDPNYKQAILKLREAVVDPIVSGPETALLWTDYVIKNRGARHLRSTTVDITFTGNYMLDFLFFLLVIAAAGIYLILTVARLVVKRLLVLVWRKRDANLTENEYLATNANSMPMECSHEDTSEKSPQDTAFIIEPDILAALGEVTEDTRFGEKIHDLLARLWLPILRKGIEKEAKEKLMKQYLVPENCPFLQAPKLNPEIASTMSNATQNKDKRVESTQQQLGIGITVLNKGLSLLLENRERVKAIKFFSDSSRILCDLHHMETEVRKKLTTPGLDRAFLNLIQDQDRDETLFGQDLSEKIRIRKLIKSRVC